MDQKFMAATWVRSNEIIWEELHGEALLVSPSTGSSWTLNATAAAIWGLCDGTRGLLEMAECFARVSGQNVGRSRREIAAFCETFKSLGLLRASTERLPARAGSGNAVFMNGLDTPPAFRALGLGEGPRRRPSPRGNSGPG